MRSSDLTSSGANAITQLSRDIVHAGRILLHHKIVDAFGHVSARHPLHIDRFMMSRRIAPGLANPEDIREFSDNGELTVDDETPVFLERYIHSAIYAARPDVKAVVHSHSAALIAFGIVKDVPLRAVCHTGRFLGVRVPIFEIRDIAGSASNLLIGNQQLGEALAAALGDAHVVLMRGHGSTTVGTSVQEATLRAIYTEANARILIAARSLGEVNYLTAGEAATFEQTKDLAIERTWQYWKSELGLN